jgi:hypothetical protein
MNKAKIVSKTLKEMGFSAPESHSLFSEEQDEEAFVISVLRDALPEGVDIRTCEDFRHMNVICCQSCHGHYAHYDMRVVQLPDASPAWVCDAVRWAIYSEQYRELQKWSETPRRKNCSEKSSARMWTHRPPQCGRN